MWFKETKKLLHAISRSWQSVLLLVCDSNQKKGHFWLAELNQWRGTLFFLDISVHKLFHFYEWNFQKLAVCITI